MKNKINVCILIITLMMITLNLKIYAQPTIQRDSCFGGSADEVAHSVQQTQDKGYIVAGYTQSRNDDGDVHRSTTGNDKDFWIVKLDPKLDTTWTRAYGGDGEDIAYCVFQTKDGNNYVVAGTTVTASGKRKIMVMKLDLNGNRAVDIHGDKIQDAILPIDDAHEATSCSIIENRDGNYVVALSGTPNQPSNCPSNAGGRDVWVMKLDSSDGSVIMTNGMATYPKCGDQQVFSITQTTDKGYIIAGLTSTSNGNSATGYDFYVLKIDSNLNKENGNGWETTLGGSKDDEAFSVIQGKDGNYIVAGFTTSNNGDTPQRLSTILNPRTDADLWVMKLDSGGTHAPIWNKRYGGSGNESGQGILCPIVQISDATGTYDVIASSTNSSDGDISPNDFHGGSSDFWVVKINDDNGTIKWNKTYGGAKEDIAYSINTTTDGGYIIAGSTKSDISDGLPCDVTGLHNPGTDTSDFWVVKLSPDIMGNPCVCKGDKGDPGTNGKDGSNGTNDSDGAPGRDGTNGTPGTPGTPGINGSTWLTGLTDPPNGTTTASKDGDLFLNTITDNYFQKTANGWGAPLGTLKGDKGMDGVFSLPYRQDVTLPKVIKGAQPAKSALDITCENGTAIIGTSKKGVGISGQSTTSFQAGVLGENTLTSGVTYGVYGISDSQEGYAVYGHAKAGEAGHFDGNVTIEGKLTAPSIAGNVTVEGNLEAKNSVTDDDEPLRIIRGTVNFDSKPIVHFIQNNPIPLPEANIGYTCTKYLDENGNEQRGLYLITFNKPFTTRPSAVVTQVYQGPPANVPEDINNYDLHPTGGNTKDNAVIVRLNVDHMIIKTGGEDGVGRWRAFSFIVMGPK
jgi:hypothetical protein